MCHATSSPSKSTVERWGDVVVSRGTLLQKQLREKRSAVASGDCRGADTRGFRPDRTTDTRRTQSTTGRCGTRSCVCRCSRVVAIMSVLETAHCAAIRSGSADRLQGHDLHQPSALAGPGDQAVQATGRAANGEDRVVNQRHREGQEDLGRVTALSGRGDRPRGVLATPATTASDRPVIDGEAIPATERRDRTASASGGRLVVEDFTERVVIDPDGTRRSCRFETSIVVRSACRTTPHRCRGPDLGLGYPVITCPMLSKPYPQPPIKENHYEI